MTQQRTDPEQDEHFLAAIVAASEDAIVGATVDGIITSWNPAAERLFGFSAEEAVDAPIALVVPPDRAEERDRSIKQLRRGERVEPFESERLTKAGRRIPVSVGVCGIRDARGQLTAIVASVRNISRLKQAEAQIRARVLQLEAVAALGQAALEGDPLENLLERAVSLIADTLGVEFCKILELSPDRREFLLKAGVGWRPGLVGRATVGAGLDSQAGYTLSARQPVIVRDLNSETRFSGPALLRNHGVISGISVIIAGDEDRSPYGVLGAHTSREREFTTDDIHFVQSVANVIATAIQRKRAEEQQRMLVRELSHRVKNILAVAQAIAKQTGTRATSVEEFRDALDGRLKALLSVHELLTERRWRSVSLRDLARAVLAPYVTDERVRSEVDDLAILPAAAQTFALLLHELATNASKYGALSVPGGQVALEATASGEELCLAWRESGGPPVQKPARQGFGTSVICQTVGFQHQGRVDLDWHPSGLTCNLTVPLKEIAA